jgi:hypothetical protein
MTKSRLEIQKKLEQQAALATARFNPTTGKPLSPEELKARPSYPFIQKLIYIPRVSEEILAECKKKGMLRAPTEAAYPYVEKPLYLWSMKEKPEQLPILPRHGKNAFIEDHIHDWSIWQGKLVYGSRFYHEGGVWVLLEFQSEPTLK